MYLQKPLVNVDTRKRTIFPEFALVERKLNVINFFQKVV